MFEELGLIKTQGCAGVSGKERSINVVDYKGKVELDDSVRYREGMDERELKIIDRLAAMTVDERLRFNNYQCDIMGNMTMEEVKEHAAELDEKIDAYLGI